MEEPTRPDNKTIREYTMNIGIANLIAIPMIIPVIALFFLPFILIWDYETFQAGYEMYNDYFLYILVGGILVHELLHGLTWGLLASNGLKSVKFGVKWKFLTPYCHCKEPLKVKHYKIGATMPLIVMGIIPSLTGLIIGHGGVMAFGIFFTCAAGGDMIALYMLRKLDNNSYVSDHPDKLGFIQETE